MIVMLFILQLLIYIQLLYIWVYLSIFVGLFEHDFYVILIWVLNKHWITSFLLLGLMYILIFKFNYDGPPLE